VVVESLTVFKSAQRQAANRYKQSTGTFRWTKRLDHIIMRTIILTIFSLVFFASSGQTLPTLKDAKPIIFYKISSRGDTIDWSYGLVSKKDTFNVTNSSGEKKGFWVEYFYGRKVVGNYKNGHKVGLWTSIEKTSRDTSWFDYGMLIEKKQYLDKMLWRHTKLNTARDSAFQIEYHKNGKIRTRETLCLSTYPCKLTDTFTGFWEHLSVFTREEWFDENGKLEKVRDPKK